MVHRIHRLPAKSIPIVFVLLALLIVLPPAQAGRFHPRISAEGGALVINGQTAVRSSGEQCRQAAERLDRSGGESVSAQKITRRHWQVQTSGGSVVFDVPRSEARALGTTSAALAERWAASINALLAMPPLHISPGGRPVIIPTGETRFLHVGGAAPADSIHIRDAAQWATDSTYHASSRGLQILGLQPGLTTVVVSATDADGQVFDAPVSVLVENRAARLSTQTSATVTGTPAAPAALVRQAAYNALYRSINLEPGALVELIQGPSHAHALPTGHSEQVPITVRAAGSNLLPVETTTTVTVTNDASHAPLIAQTLFYSNVPERVDKPQTLFTGYLPPADRPARLVYHHINDGAAPLLLRVEIINTTAADAAIHLIANAAGPFSDPVQVGFRVGADFLPDLQSWSGLILTLPAKSRLTLLAQKLQPGQVMSGLVEMTQMTGKPGGLLTRVAAEPYAPVDLGGYGALIDPPGAEDGAYPVVPLSDQFAEEIGSLPLSKGIYGTPSLSLSGAYSVGGSWMHLNLGTKDAIARVADQTASNRLDGNYGVLYHVTVTLNNPTGAPRPVALLFEAGAGLAAGIFTVDGGPDLLLNPVEPPNDVQIAKYTLMPGETRTVHLQTLPLSGSAYPAFLLAHAL